MELSDEVVGWDGMAWHGMGRWDGRLLQSSARMGRDGIRVGLKVNKRMGRERPGRDGMRWDGMG